MALVPTTHSQIDEEFEFNWEIFLWGEYAIKPIIDFDLSVPKSWFEYEEDFSME